MEYNVNYSRRKTVAISVKGGAVTVKAPIGYPKEKIAPIVEKHIRWIEGALIRDSKKRALYENLSKSEITELKRAAASYFRPLVDRYAALLSKSYKRITITEAKTRFGSCSSSGCICFSYRLMLYPEAAREYVALHEVAHLVEMNHSKRFYAIIERYMPDYRKRRALLK